MFHTDRWKNQKLYIELLRWFFKLFVRFNDKSANLVFEVLLISYTKYIFGAKWLFFNIRKLSKYLDSKFRVGTARHPFNQTDLSYMSPFYKQLFFEY